ncbi:hypothetical protein V5F89_12360 [Pelagerythrobacter marensis]|uniref:Uncharacterized protein n=1 Tax=Pelagerythrobacter marensis TaxID=543877 RepID=A0ABZ2D5I4_9SPHN
MADEKVDNEVFELIASAIQTANLDFPDTGDGSQWDQQMKSNEESRHLARAVLERLWAKGYEIGARSDA